MNIRPAHHHLADNAGIGEIRKLAKECGGINRKTAVVVPAILGSMPFFWFANILALCSLPAILTLFDSEVLKGALGLSSFFPHVILKASLIGLVAWIAQTYVQLVALPVLQVSNNAQMAQSEANTHVILTDAESTREHTEKLLDLMDTRTAGGLHDILEAVQGGKKNGPAKPESST